METKGSLGHLWLFWFYPVLTAFHILTVYWY